MKILEFWAKPSLVFSNDSRRLQTHGETCAGAKSTIISF